ncbi:phospholipid scramblase family member 5 isoform X3 [Sus scrofa]|uniref:phospholipid scramblase family member 5 isoform X3 n=1 Tax=Sus scrofa TaxID=9823 RepID=UPI000A2B1C10|nr:phospholipid scramblase family member 5 isoform X3 [Sus scrofa]
MLRGQSGHSKQGARTKAQDAQKPRSRGLPGCLPGAPDPDQSFHTSGSGPGNQVWQRGLPPPGNLLPGLEYLSQLDLIIIHQQVELLGMILGTETSNKYEIKNSLGQRIYFAVEESICFNRTFCSTLRSCTLKITDNSGQEVMTVNRPLRCNSCWCPCYLQEVKTIDEKLTIGKISKYWSGFVNDVFTNADNFGIHVPADLDVTVKAVMIGACFLFVSMVLESIGGLFLSFSLVI